MSRPMHVRLFVAFAVVSLLLVACGGGGGKEPTKEPATATPRTAPTLEGASKEFFGLLQQALNATFKVTYHTTSAEAEPGDTYVIYNRPPMTRIDIIPPDATVPASIIIGGNRTTSTIACSNGPNAWQCTNIEPPGDTLLAAAAPFSLLTAADLTSYEVSEDERRTIAGQDARCFSLQPRQPEEERLDYCFDANGVPLYSAPLFGVVEAVEFSTQVSPEDFAPPAQP